MSLEKAVELILEVEKEVDKIPMDQIDDYCAITSTLYDLACALEHELIKQRDRDTEKEIAMAAKQGV